MDFTNSLQKLASYRQRRTQSSKELLERGIPLLRSGTYTRQGDEGEQKEVARTATYHTDLCATSGWDNLEKLFLAALDQGDIETADVGPLVPSEMAHCLILRSNVYNSLLTASPALLVPMFCKGFGWKQRNH